MPGLNDPLMKPCPGCLGAGSHDFREEDADWARTMSPAVLERLAMEGRHPLGIVKCDRCDGTGEVTDVEFDEVMREARRVVGHIAAMAERKINDEERRARL